MCYIYTYRFDHSTKLRSTEQSKCTSRIFACFNSGLNMRARGTLNTLYIEVQLLMSNPSSHRSFVCFKCRKIAFASFIADPPGLDPWHSSTERREGASGCVTRMDEEWIGVPNPAHASLRLGFPAALSRHLSCSHTVLAFCIIPPLLLVGLWVQSRVAVSHQDGENVWACVHRRSWSAPLGQGGFWFHFLGLRGFLRVLNRLPLLLGAVQQYVQVGFGFHPVSWRLVFSGWFWVFSWRWVSGLMRIYRIDNELGWCLSQLARPRYGAWAASLEARAEKGEGLWIQGQFLALSGELR